MRARMASAPSRTHHNGLTSGTHSPPRGDAVGCAGRSTLLLCAELALGGRGSPGSRNEERGDEATNKTAGPHKAGGLPAVNSLAAWERGVSRHFTLSRGLRGARL